MPNQYGLYTYDELMLIYGQAMQNMMECGGTYMGPYKEMFQRHVKGDFGDTVQLTSKQYKEFRYSASRLAYTASEKLMRSPITWVIAGNILNNWLKNRD